MGNVNMEASQINYRGGVKKMSVEEALKNTSGEAAAIAQLQEDVANLNGSKANKADIATEFSDLTNYNAGDLVYYEGDLYEFQVDHVAGSWETSEVIQKDLSDIINTLKSGLNALGTFVLLAHKEMSVASVWTPLQDISINVDAYRYFGVKLTKENNTITGTPLCLFSREEFLLSNASKPLCALLNTAESSDAYNVFVQYNGESLTPVYYYRGANVSDTLYLTIFGIV